MKGYNSRLCRKPGSFFEALKHVVYLLLIDKPPAHSTTMMTAKLKAKLESDRAGQEYVIFRADLYPVALHVIEDNAEKFGNVHLRLGGMHLLMSYRGSIGTLMAETGVVEIPFGVL